MITIKLIMTSSAAYKVTLPLAAFVLFSTRRGTTPSLGIEGATDVLGLVISSLLLLLLGLLGLVVMALTLVVQSPPAHLLQLRDHSFLDLCSLGTILTGAITWWVTNLLFQLTWHLAKGPHGIIAEQ